jgi:hypothetical protein
MKLEEAIKIYNKYHNDEIIKEFDEARSILVEEHHKRKPKQVFYKSSELYDYYIEEPYEELTFGTNGVEFKQHYYSAVGKRKDGKSTSYFCVSLCKYTKEKIIEMIEEHIKKDNLSKVK